MSKIDVICDHSQQNLKVVPLRVLDMCNLQMLYLEGNELETLPLNIFQRLPKLNWLDLRNNQLREIPVGVANHACLENLLLEQNSLVRLPNELGLVPNLTVLQLAKNPLTYPSQNIISKGTKAVSFYLRNEYNKEHDLPLECEETAGAFFRSEENEKITKKKRKSSKIKADVRELLRKASLHRKLQIENMPTISIKSLSPKSSSNEIKSKESSSEAQHSPRKTHKVTRYCSKLSVPTYYNSNKYLGAKKTRSSINGSANKELKILDHELKEVWLEKLKQLLAEQERSLQQERNLQALKSWRLMKKLELPREVKPNAKLLEAPYDTNPDYEKMPSRRDLASDLERILRRRKNVPKRKCDLQKLINELISQLKTLEVASEANQGQSDLEKSEKEIQKIVSLHKKVIELQQKNQNSW